MLRFVELQGFLISLVEILSIASRKSEDLTARLQFLKLEYPNLEDLLKICFKKNPLTAAVIGSSRILKKDIGHVLQICSEVFSIKLTTNCEDTCVKTTPLKSIPFCSEFFAIPVKWKADVSGFVNVILVSSD